MNSLFIAATYFLLSLIAFCFLYSLPRYLSGDRFRWKWFVMCFALVISSGSFHMSTAQYGYEIMLPALEPILKGNDAVGWIAFVSI